MVGCGTDENGWLFVMGGRGRGAKGERNDEEKE